MKKTFADWEKEQGLFTYEARTSTKTITLDEFMAMYEADPEGFHSLNYKDRTKFLKDNGYELTRENLFADLSAQPKPEE